MPVVGLGTWQMGGKTELDPTNDDARDIAAIRSAIDNGVTHIDTAELYAAGHSEELVAKAIEGYDRSKLFIVSKLLRTVYEHDKIIEHCKGSLKRLGISYLDMYLLHGANDNVPLKGIISALDELVSLGLVRNIGVCNFSKERLARAQSFSKNKIVVNQVHYNLVFREPEATGLLEYCQKNDVLLEAWRPFQHGELGKDAPDVLVEIAKKYDKTPVQVVLNWLISQENVVTIFKTHSSEHLNENLGALGWNLNKEDIEKLRTEFPGQQKFSNAVPLG